MIFILRTSTQNQFTTEQSPSVHPPHTYANFIIFLLICGRTQFHGPKCCIDQLTVCFRCGKKLPLGWLWVVGCWRGCTLSTVSTSTETWTLWDWFIVNWYFMKASLCHWAIMSLAQNVWTYMYAGGARECQGTALWSKRSFLCVRWIESYRPSRLLADT
jgi:hypothetical protein